MATNRDHNQKVPVAIVGFWAAVVIAVLNVWYFVAFVLYQPILHAPWPGIAAYAASFQPFPLLLWVVPTFFIGPVFLVMITCLHVWAADEKQVWSQLALVFAVVYAAVLSVNYYIQMTVVPHNLTTGMTEGMSLWLYADPFYPYNIPGALEAVGFGSMGVSFLFASQVFGAARLERWVRWTCFATGLSALVVFTDPLYPLPFVIVLAFLVAGFVLLAAAPLLLAILFRRSTAGPVPESQRLLTQSG